MHGFRDHVALWPLFVVMIQACPNELARFLGDDGRLMDLITGPVGMERFSALQFGEDEIQCMFKFHGEVPPQCDSSVSGARLPLFAPA